MESGNYQLFQLKQQINPRSMGDWTIILDTTKILHNQTWGRENLIKVHDDWMVIDVLQLLLCTWQAKWADRPPKVMKRSQRWNNHQICPHRDSKTGGRDLWYNVLLLDHGWTTMKIPIETYFFWFTLKPEATTSNALWMKSTISFCGQENIHETQL